MCIPSSFFLFKYDIAYGYKACYSTEIKLKLSTYYTYMHIVTRGVFLRHNFCIRFFCSLRLLRKFLGATTPRVILYECMLRYWEILFYIVYGMWIIIVFRPRGVCMCVASDDPGKVLLFRPKNSCFKYFVLLKVLCLLCLPLESKHTPCNVYSVCGYYFLYVLYVIPFIQ